MKLRKRDSEKIFFSVKCASRGRFCPNCSNSASLSLTLNFHFLHSSAPSSSSLLPVISYCSVKFARRDGRHSLGELILNSPKCWMRAEKDAPRNWDIPYNEEGKYSATNLHSNIPGENLIRVPIYLCPITYLSIHALAPII